MAKRNGHTPVERDILSYSRNARDKRGIPREVLLKAAKFYAQGTHKLPVASASVIDDALYEYVMFRRFGRNNVPPAKMLELLDSFRGDQMIEGNGAD